MHKPYEHPLKEYINACLQAYTGTDSQLKSCLELILDLSSHDNPQILRLHELEPLQRLLNNLEDSPVEIPESEISESREWARQYLKDTHQTMVVGQFLKPSLTSNENALVLFSAVNRRRLKLMTEKSNDENKDPEHTTELTLL